MRRLDKSSEPTPTGDNSRRNGRSQPLKVQYEVVVVGGEEGRYLAAGQAEAIRNLLRWIAENPNQTQADGTAP